MDDSEVEQFLNLIAENAQLKAEISSLKRYSGMIRTFDRTLERMSVEAVIGEEVERPGLNNLISQIRQGITSVESADSFKQRMIAERNKKRSEVQQQKLANLKERLVQLEARKKEFATVMESEQERIDDHRKMIAESHGLKEKFVSQLKLLTTNIESLNQTRTELSDRIALAQVAGVETRRKIEQTHRTLSEVTQNESKESQELTSMKRIVADLRSQLKAPVS
jgi:chromosome segregation ATPase